jgi:arabinan endo-1,5-alpha-L-arabinosidase
MKSLLALALFLAALLGRAAAQNSIPAPSAAPKPVDVYLIAGQSNATGQGYLKNLPAGFAPDQRVLLFNSGRPHLNSGAPADTWIPLRQASESPDRFGPELGFGNRIQELSPNHTIALIKHAHSGTNLYAQWNPGASPADTAGQGPQFRIFVQTVEQGLQGLRDQGYTPILRGMIWQQGENDAFSGNVATANATAISAFLQANSVTYGAHLAHFIQRVREQFNAPNLLFVYGYVLPTPNNQPGRDAVRQGEHDVDQNSGAPLAVPGAFVVATDDLSQRAGDPNTPYPNDHLHFGTAGQLELGRRMADTMHAHLADSPAPPAASVTTPSQPVAAPSPAAVAPADDQTALLASLGKRAARVHDPSSIVKCDGEYWIFYTGRGVPSWHSPDLLTWERGPRLFDAPPAWVAQTVPGNTRGYFWAPDVIHLKDRYLVYYAVSTFGKNTSAIGVASSPTLDPANAAFHWTDLGPVVQSAPGDNFNAIDPAVTLDATGRLWLAYGSYWTGIKLTQLDPATGLRLAPNSPVYSLAHAHDIEASYIYYHDGYYYLFVNWGVCCKGVNSTYNIRVGRGKKITGPYLDKNGVDMMDGGGSLFLGSSGPFIGPGHAAILADGGQYWFSCHFYDATDVGHSYLAIKPLHWDAQGWPVADDQK